MPRGLESEIKLGLPDEAAWRWVRGQMTDTTEIHQTNHFFEDPSGVLAGARIGVRIRGEGRRFRLSVKGDAAGSASAISQRVELESDLDPATADEMLANGFSLGEWLADWRARTGDADERVASLLDRLAPLAAEPLTAFGHFETDRTRGRIPTLPELAPYEVELDRTRFSATRVDYELEVEAPSVEAAAGLEAAEHALRDWLANEGIEPSVPESKLARFQRLRTGDTSTEPLASGGR